MFKPNIQQMSTPIRIQKRNSITINGAPKISYNSEPDICFCNFKSKGGTIDTQSGILTIHDTAELIMWYDPTVKKQDRILLNDDENIVYEIKNIPENVEMRNIYMLLKVERVVSA